MIKNIIIIGIIVSIIWYAKKFLQQNYQNSIFVCGQPLDLYLYWQFQLLYQILILSSHLSRMK